ncbi:MAG: glutathione S-transferase, partial [Hyphomicrobiales bacterium]|nr:glutathione S-transferase [Hyphomicrobiales bacterium]
MSLTLIIGNKNYSSWSLRAWIAMTAAGIAFDEVFVPLSRPDTKERIKKHSPAGKVPVLLDGHAVVWESLAILEHLAERFPKAGLWPSEPAARAHARSIAAEMHAGFQALRGHCPMNLWRPVERLALTS